MYYLEIPYIFHNFFHLSGVAFLPVSLSERGVASVPMRTNEEGVV